MHLTQILLFTGWQALLSSLFSISGGWLLARLIFSQQWLWVEKWLMIVMVIPSLSVAIGYMDLFQQWGYCGVTGLMPIVLCHCFFNVPLATLLIIKGYQQVSPNLWQLVQSNRMPGLATLSKIEIPLLKITLINTSSLIFAYCFASFSIPLLIGGGPQTSTITVALYYSLIVQGQIDQAMWLMLIKLCIGVIVLLFIKIPIRKLATHQYIHKPSALSSLNFPGPIKNIIIFSAAILLLSPLFNLSQHFLKSMFYFNWQPQYGTAICNSLSLAIVSAVMTLGLSIGILSINTRWRYWLEQLSYMILMIPSFVLSYILLKIAISYELAWLNAPTCLIIINCVISLPLGLKILSAAWYGIDNQYNILMQTLRLPLSVALRMIVLPLMLPALRLSLALSISYCLGDIGGILLFDQHEIITLPFIIYDACNRFDYQTSQVLSGILMVMSLTLFSLIHQKSPYHVTTH